MNKFTERFLKVPVTIVETDEITDKQRDVAEDFYYIIPFEIWAYRKHFGDEGYDNKTTVEFKNGTNIIVLLPIEKFEELLNKHQ